MKTVVEKQGSDLVLRYRVYQRKNTRYKTYVAWIAGTHPDYILDRGFLTVWENANPRWSQYTSLLPWDGIYEISVKRYDLAGSYLSRERLWLVASDGETHIYEEGEMNNQYVLYCAGLLRKTVKEVG